MILRQLTSMLILPANAILTIPAILYFLCGGRKSLRLFPAPFLLLTRLVGVLLVVVGIPLIVFTVRDFIKIGQGTLAPWDPTRKLVVKGVYRYVRNPMISGVISVLFGVALLMNTICHLGWATLFTLLNMIYMPLSEEPGLEKRFGEAYSVYKQNVPRWIPRLDPWGPPGNNYE